MKAAWLWSKMGKDLTFAAANVTVSEVQMKYRFTTAVVLLVYFCVSLFVGVTHQHQTQNVRGQKTCLACEWQLNAVTDVPTVAPLVFGCLQETPAPVFKFTSYSAFSFSFSPSRAPPAALA